MRHFFNIFFFLCNFFRNIFVHFAHIFLHHLLLFNIVLYLILFRGILIAFLIFTILALVLAPITRGLHRLVLREVVNLVGSLHVVIWTFGLLGNGQHSRHRCLLWFSGDLLRLHNVLASDLPIPNTIRFIIPVFLVLDPLEFGFNVVRGTAVLPLRRGRAVGNLLGAVCPVVGGDLVFHLFELMLLHDRLLLLGLRPRLGCRLFLVLAEAPDRLELPARGHLGLGHGRLGRLVGNVLGHFGGSGA